MSGYRPGRMPAEVPVYFHALEAAILAVYAREVPESPAAITPPGPWTTKLPMDLEDYAELLDGFARVLQMGDPSMLLRLLWSADVQTAEGAREIGRELLAGLNLTVVRSRHTKNTLSRQCLRQLSSEARGIAEAVRTPKVPDHVEEGIRELLEAEELTHVERARLRRDLPLPAKGGLSPAGRAALQLRFPFLTWEDVDWLLVGAPKTPEAAGDELVTRRLAAGIPVGRLRDILYSK